MVLAPDYITVSDLKEYLDIPATDTRDDVTLQLWVTAASRAADDVCNRKFGRVESDVIYTYRHQPAWDYHLQMWTLSISDLAAATDLEVNTVPYPDSGALLLPEDAPEQGRPYDRIGYPYTIWPTPMILKSRWWGWLQVPDQVPAAVRLQANRWNARRRSPLGVAGSPEQGSELRLLARRDPDFITALRGLARRRRTA